MKPLLTIVLFVLAFATAFTQPLTAVHSQPSPLPTPLSSPLPAPEPSAPIDSTNAPQISPLVWIGIGLLLGGAIIFFMQRSSDGR